MGITESQSVRSLLQPKTEEEVQQALRSATREELNVELCDAADQGDVERVKLLLAAGANPGANDGWALHLAVAEDHTEVIKLLKHHMNRSYGSFKRRMGLTEGMFDDPGNLKALASYGKMITGELDSYMLEVKRPFRIMIDGEDNAKFKFLFNKYRIEFELIHKDDAVMAESIYENEEPLVSLSIKDLSWDDVKEVGNLPYLSLPVEEGMSRQVKDENEFESWKNDFIKRYGSDGYLEGHKAGRYYSWKVVENSRYEEKRQRTIDSISSYYQKKGSGGYTGD